MAIVQKQVRFEYQAKNNATGLTDVKAQVYLNGVAKAVGSSAISATANANGSKIVEVDSTNSPGLYELQISAADLAAWGVAVGQTNTVSGYINSATAPAPAPFREDITIANTDDIATLIGTPATSSVSGDIATLTSAVQALQNGSISNGVGFVLPIMLIPASGSNTYQIPITIMNNDGALVDPTSNLVTVGVKNAAGTDRGTFLVGSSGTPATVSATRASVGQYSVQVSIPSTEVEEQLIFSFAYTLAGNATVRFGVSQTLTDGGAGGYALQSTLLAVQTTVNTINSATSNATYGLAAIQALLVNGTYGLSALQALLTNSTYGLSALHADHLAIEGTGFTAGADDLHSISTFVRANIFSGGRAV